MIYIVSYDLAGGEPQDYSNIEVAIESCGIANHFQRSVWLLSSDLTAVEIRDAVKSHLANSDTLFVGALGQDWAGWRTKLQAWIQGARSA